MGSIQSGIEIYDGFSQPLYSMIKALNLTVSAFEDMQRISNNPIDTSSIDGARAAANEATMAVQAMQDELSRIGGIAAAADVPPVEVPIVWESDALDVFTNSGVDRFQQEVASANSMMERLSQTQQQINAQAANIDIFPSNAVSDMNSMQNRIQAIQDRINQIANNPLNMGADIANAELEQMREQLNQAVTAQKALNEAVEDMDVQTANDAYNRLSQIVSGIERHIRDNVDEQGRFNQAIQQGAENADNLMNTIKSAAAAYATIQTAKAFLDTSDALIQTQSRLNLMNDGIQTTQALMDMVYQSAQNARGSFSEMADVVARFGNNAGDAFSSSAEVVAFSELVQKQMTIAGASTAEASAAMLQLSQALGSGVLRGDELNSIFEQAPNLIQNIADYLDVGIGEIREMASEGELTADVVKNAIFAATDDINAKFASMPMTWGQVCQSFQNTALVAFQPVLEYINGIANSEAFNAFVSNAENALYMVAAVVQQIFDTVGAVGNFIYDNWSWISPVIYGVAAALLAYIAVLGVYNAIQAISNGLKAAAAFQEAVHAAAIAMSTGETFLATAAQYGLNAALMACPITWVVAGVIALVAALTAVVRYLNVFGARSVTVFGTVCGLINVVIQWFVNLGLTIANIALGIWNVIGALCANMSAAFSNAISGIQGWFYGLMSTAMTVVSNICAALNQLPFVEFDFSGIVGMANDYAAKSAAAAGNKEAYTSISDAFGAGMSTFSTWSDGWASSAFSAGAAWGDGIMDKISDFSASDLFGTDGLDMSDYLSAYELAGNGGGGGMGSVPGGVSDIAGNTGDIANSLDVTDEELKYLRDIAEQETVNRFTIAEVAVDIGGIINQVNGVDDLDGLVDGILDGVNEAVDIVTEGVHT